MTLTSSMLRVHCIQGSLRRTWAVHGLEVPHPCSKSWVTAEWNASSALSHECVHFLCINSHPELNLLCNDHIHTPFNVRIWEKLYNFSDCRILEYLWRRYLIEQVCICVSVCVHVQDSMFPSVNGVYTINSVRSLATLKFSLSLSLFFSPFRKACIRIKGHLKLLKNKQLMLFCQAGSNQGNLSHMLYSVTSLKCQPWPT